MKEEAERSRVGRISWLVWGLLAVIVVLLISAFLRAWTLHQVLDEKRSDLSPLLQTERERQVTLEAELTYVQSEEYVEEWSQARAGMTRGEGEVLVVPLVASPTPTPVPSPSPTPTPAPEPLPFWQRWWQALTGGAREP
ncbi:MAG: hypothetical protein ACLFU8_00360 [Anaerolineales bacterium]